MSETKTSSRRLTAEQRRADALALRMAGADYRSIGRALGISGQSAWRLVGVALARLKAKNDEKAEQVRSLEVQRLDSSLRAIWTRVLQGDLSAIATSLRISERRAALLGLDAPRGVQVGGPDGGPLRFAAGVPDAWDIERLSPEQLRQLREIETAATSGAAKEGSR